MDTMDSVGSALAQLGLLVLLAEGARTWLAHAIQPEDVPTALRQRIATIDRLHPRLVTGAAALVVGGVCLVLLG